MDLRTSAIIALSTSISGALVLMLGSYLQKLEGRMTAGAVIMGIIGILAVLASLVFYVLWIIRLSDKIEALP